MMGLGDSWSTQGALVMLSLGTPLPMCQFSSLRAGLGGTLPKVECRAWDGGASVPLGCEISLVNRVWDPSARSTNLGQLVDLGSLYSI